MGRAATAQEFMATGQTWIVDDQPTILDGITIEPTAELKEAVNILLDSARKQGIGDQLRDKSHALQCLAFEVVNKGLKQASKQEARDRSVRIPSSLFTLDVTLLTAKLVPNVQFDLTDTTKPERNAHYMLTSNFLWVGHAATMHSQPVFVADELYKVVVAAHDAII